MMKMVFFVSPFRFLFFIFSVGLIAIVCSYLWFLNFLDASFFVSSFVTGLR